MPQVVGPPPPAPKAFEGPEWDSSRPRTRIPAARDLPAWLTPVEDDCRGRGCQEGQRQPQASKDTLWQTEGPPFRRNGWMSKRRPPDGALEHKRRTWNRWEFVSAWTAPAGRAMTPP